MIPLHFIVLGVNSIDLIIFYALADVRNVQVPVRLNHDTFARVWEGENPREEITNPLGFTRLQLDRRFQADFNELAVCLVEVIRSVVGFGFVQALYQVVVPRCHLLDNEPSVRFAQIK